MWCGVQAAHFDEGYDAYGGYDETEYDDGYGDGYGAGYGAYGTRGARGAAGRGAAMRGMGRGMARGCGAARGGRGGGMMKAAYQSSTGFSVHMRGLPYAATETDIVQVNC